MGDFPDAYLRFSRCASGFSWMRIQIFLDAHLDFLTCASRIYYMRIQDLLHTYPVLDKIKARMHQNGASLSIKANYQPFIPL